MAHREQITAWISRVVGAVHTSLAETDLAAYGPLQPDVVAWPGSPDEIIEVLTAARETAAQVAVTGSASRAFHAWPKKDKRPRVALDTSRLTNILRIDQTSLLVESQCGIRLEHLEEALRRQGLTLGAYPDSVFASTLGGILADPSPLAYTPRAGHLIDNCVAVQAVTPLGELVEMRLAPRRAVGPDLRHLYVGSGGTLGVITSAVLRVRHVTTSRTALAFVFPDATSALMAGRDLLAHGIRPERLRIMADPKTATALVDEHFKLKAALGLVLDGPRDLMQVERLAAEQLVAARKGSELPQEYADRWMTSYPDPSFRGSDDDDAAESHGIRAFVKLRYSQASAALARLDDARLGTLPADAPADAEATDAVLLRDVWIYFDQLSLHDFTLWVCAHAKCSHAALAKLLEEASLQPGRHRRRAAEGHASALAYRLRQELDPAHIMLSPKWH
jgi:FAD/FMN-containing dehydrogenase